MFGLLSQSKHRNLSNLLGDFPHEGSRSLLAVLLESERLEVELNTCVLIILFVV